MREQLVRHIVGVRTERIMKTRLTIRLAYGQVNWQSRSTVEAVPMPGMTCTGDTRAASPVLAVYHAVLHVARTDVCCRGTPGQSMSSTMGALGVSALHDAHRHHADQR
jgi:hypothetical protein